ncbi:MAG: dsdX 1, partial [Anaerospora sp.]|nr:dsdX 1 [Anaerospora sp.]
ILDSGIGDILKSVLTAIHISPLIMAWVIAIVMRFAIGSATVAMMTSAGFITPVLIAYPALDPALVAVAIGAGAIGASHVTDPGFWFVKESMGIPMNKMFGIGCRPDRCPGSGSNFRTIIHTTIYFLQKGSLRNEMQAPFIVSIKGDCPLF